MNTNCPPASIPPSATSAKTPITRGVFASLGRLINTAGFASVDLTDMLFATLPRRDGAPYEAVVRPNCSE
jgi:hypothetical protein